MTRSHGADGWRLIILTAVLGSGVAARFYGLDWGIESLRELGETGRRISLQEASFHPDAGTLQQVTASLRESIHPHLLVFGTPLLYSVYGPVFMYLFHGVAWLLCLAVDYSAFALTPPESADWTRIAGRTVSALAGSITLWLTYRLGALAYHRRVGVLAMGLLGATALHIQSSHFSTVDVLMTLWTTWSLLPMMRLATTGRQRDYLAAAVLMALAAATKLNALVILLPYLLAHLARIRSAGLKLADPRTHLPALFGLAAFVLAFALLVPSSWLRPADYFGPEYHGNVFYSARLNEGAVTMRGALHYPGTIPYLYQALHLFPAGMGVGFAIAAILGGSYALTRRTLADLLLAGFVLAYVVIVGQLEAKYIRYFVVLMPLVAIMAARWLAEIWHWREGTYPGRLGRLAVVAAIGWTVSYGVAFTTIYGRPDPRVEAIQWIARHARPGATVTFERGHNGMSTLISAAGLPNTPIDVAHFFGRPVPAQILTDGDYLGFSVTGPLAASEYLVFSEDQLVARDHSPLAAQYYDALFAGDLGFELERKITRSPQLFGLSWDDGEADLSWRHFDHPTIYVFRRISRLRFLTQYPGADIYFLRRREDAMQVIQRAVLAEEFLFFEHCLPRSLRQRTDREVLARRVNELLSHAHMAETLGRPEAYFEEEGDWKLHVVEEGGRYRVRLSDGQLIP